MSGRPAAETVTAVMATVREALVDLGLAWRENGPAGFAVSLPGESRLSTTCTLDVGEHGLLVRAFVSRRPEEAHGEVYRWLLERNARGGLVGFALDAAGDVWLVGRLPLGGVTAGLVDRVLGEVLGEADGSFTRIIELGFGAAVTREWAWRERRGEPTDNLEPFRRLRPS